MQLVLKDYNHELSLLDIKIEQTHQTTPCYFGSKFEIDRVRNGWD